MEIESGNCPCDSCGVDYSCPQIFKLKISFTPSRGRFVVTTTAIDHDSDDAFGLTTKPTNIIATNYRQFVANYPTRTSYFQPVIEQLEYITPELIGSPPFLLVEGITDYYALKFVFDKWSTKTFALMPGCGAGASGPQISSMLGRGERFIVLLDDDKAGKQAAQRYPLPVAKARSIVSFAISLSSTYTMPMGRLSSAR
jgi:hypothetical protein